MAVWSYCHMAKMTFSLNDEAVRTQYAAKDEKLSDEERSRKLQLIRQLRSQPQTRDAAAVDKELAGLRRSRRVGRLRG